MAFIKIFPRWPTLPLRRILLLLLRKDEEDIVPLLAELTAITTQRAMQQVCISSRLRRTSSGETDGAISWSANMETTDSSSQNQLFCARNISEMETSEKRWQVAGNWWKVCNVCTVVLLLLGYRKKVPALSFRSCSVDTVPFFSLIKSWYFYFCLHYGLIRYLWT